MANLCTDPWGSVLLKGAKAQQNARHAMDIELLSEDGVFSDEVKPHFVTTYSELPALCRNLLSMSKYAQGSLVSMKLRLIIGGEVGLDGDRAEGYEVAESRDVIERYPSGGDSIGGSLASMDNKIGTTSSRVHRLLEPFRQLHSIRDAQIVGPLSKDYKAEVLAQISKPPPSCQHYLDHLLTTSEKATNTFDSGDFALSISKLRNTVDELDGARHLCIGDGNAEIITGPYAGFAICEAFKDIEFAVWTKLAWACLKTGDVNTAANWLIWILQTFIDGSRGHGNAPPGGHKIAMVYYLESQIWEERDRIGHHDTVRRSHDLEHVVAVLKEGLRHEPGNSLLERELEKKELELAKEREIESLMGMPDRLDNKLTFEEYL